MTEYTVTVKLGSEASQSTARLERTVREALREQYGKQNVKGVKAYKLNTPSQAPSTVNA